MAQQVKNMAQQDQALAIKTEDLNLVPIIQAVEGENGFLPIVLSPHAVMYRCSSTYTCAQNKNVKYNHFKKMEQALKLFLIYLRKKMYMLF